MEPIETANRLKKAIGPEDPLDHPEIREVRLALDWVTWLYAEGQRESVNAELDVPNKSYRAHAAVLAEKYPEEYKRFSILRRMGLT